MLEGACRHLLCLLLSLCAVAVLGCTKAGEPQSGPVELRVDPPNASVTVGRTIALRAIPIDTDGNEIEGLTIGWASANEQIATVSGGVVQGIAAGATSITATFGKLRASVEVTVRSAGVARV